MVFVRDLRGVRYYDDSKGTNVGASVTAVRGIREEKVVLIAGGRDKGGSYGPLVDLSDAELTEIKTVISRFRTGTL